MNFLHAPWLFALIGLAVPIVLHLQRKRTRTLDWAAMRFLQKSLIHRRRGLTLEQLLLLACRCLLLAAFVLAMAQPWSSYPNHITSLLTIGVAVVAIIGLAWAVVSPAKPVLRYSAGAAGLAMIAIAALITWSSDRALVLSWETPRDVVFIIDGSDSMGPRSTEAKDSALQNTAPYFQRALSEAERFLDRLPSESTVAVLVAGAVTTPGKINLQRNLQAVREQIRKSEPVTGHSDLAQAIEHAKSILKRGDNAEQQIVLFTDDQWTNWQWLQDFAARNESITANNSLIGRVFPLPDVRVNLAITQLEIDERLLRAGDSVRVQIEVLNGGTQIVESASVDVLLNDTVIDTRTITRLEPGLSQSITVDLAFDKLGPHVVSARVNFADDIPGDNRFDRAIAVHPPVAVLVVNGSAATSRSRRSATYIQLALSGRATETETIDAVDLRHVTDLDRYEAIILCDVPQLPEAVAAALSQYVSRGGGLMLLMGGQCEPEFYNDWQAEDKPLMPLPLTWFHSQQPSGDERQSIDATSVTHRTLSKLVESGEHDLTDWSVSDYWQVADVPESLASVTARFTNGDPLLVEHQIGRGRVLVQTTAPEPNHNNFINRVSFPVWMHLLTRDLADSAPVRLHQKPSPQWTVELPGPLSADQTVVPNTTIAFELKEPGGNKREVVGTWVDGRCGIELGIGDKPGRYELSGATDTRLGNGPWPLTIERSAGEADLSVTTPNQLRALARQIGMTLVQADAEVIAIAGGELDVFQWWRYFAYAALLLIAIESILLMWVRYRRTGQSITTKSIPWGLRLMTPLWIAMIWSGAWLVWTQAWQIVGQITRAQFDQSTTWIGALVATLSCVVVWTYLDARWPARFELPMLMKTSRLLLVGVLGFVLLEPTHSGEEETVQQRQVIVLWDRSESMQLPIGGSIGKTELTLEDSTAGDNAAGPDINVSREAVARKVLWDGYHKQSPLFADLQAGYQVQLYEFAASPRLEKDATKKSDPPQSHWSSTTDLTAALQRSLADVPANELSGVIVLTDGCDRSPLPHNAVVAGLSRQNIPVHSIVIGDQSAIKDIEVAMVHAASQVLVGDQVTVRATIKADRLSGHTATVRFLRDGEVLETKLLQIPGDHFRTAMDFNDEPQQNAFHQYAVEIDPLEDEAIVQNNRSTANVWVTNDRLRLLIVEQRPRWEFRYLKNLFAGRDRNVSLQHVLLSPDRLAGVADPYPMPASASRAFDDCEANRLPESEQEWLKFDIIVLGDIDPEELDDNTLLTLDKFVRVRGGTLIVIAGQHAMPHRYLDTALADLLPVQRSATSIKPTETGYRLRLTDDGTSSPLLRNAYTDVNMPSVWQTLPRLHWRHSLAIAKPGATVLAWADDSPEPKHPDAVDASDSSVRSRQQALILWHRYGGGRVLQLNFDQTWRLRFWNGDEHHHQFWGRVMRWATEDRLGMGTNLVRLGIDKADYNPGDLMTVKVRLVDGQIDGMGDGVNAGDAQTRLLLYREDELVQEVSLQAVADSGGLLQAQITLPDQSGRYRVQVAGPIVDQLLAIENLQNRSVSAEFTVESLSAEGELQDIVASAAAVTPLANMTAGRVLVPETANQLLEHLGPKSLYRRDRWDVPLWNSWPVVSLFFLLLGGEWIARRWCGLI